MRDNIAEIDDICQDCGANLTEEEEHNEKCATLQMEKGARGE